MSSKEQEGERHAFCMKLFMSFVDHSIQQERFAELEHLGIGRDIIDDFEDLSASARASLANSTMRCFDFMVYADALREMVAEAKSSARRKKALTQCIARGAPYEMMQRLYGLPLRFFRKYRRQKSVTKAGVRVTDDPDIVTAIESAWETRECRFDPDTMLAIDDETNASLRVIWSVLSAYAPSASVRPAALFDHSSPVKAGIHV